MQALPARMDVVPRDAEIRAQDRRVRFAHLSAPSLLPTLCSLPPYMPTLPAKGRPGRALNAEGGSGSGLSGTLPAHLTQARCRKAASPRISSVRS